MSLNPMEDIPLEKHNGTQFIRIESGAGFVKHNKNGIIYKIQLKDGISINIPPKTKHYITNTSKKKPLKLYSLYSPPQHKHGIINKRQTDE
jgi:mannose-6-phosphate isomerase-like protein (cupin superfamily)